MTKSKPKRVYQPKLPSKLPWWKAATPLTKNQRMRIELAPRLALKALFAGEGTIEEVNTIGGPILMTLNLLDKIEEGEQYRDRLTAGRDASVRIYVALEKKKPLLNADLQALAVGLDIAIEVMTLCERWEYEAAIRKGLIADGLPDVMDRYDREAIAHIYGAAPRQKTKGEKR